MVFADRCYTYYRKGGEMYEEIGEEVQEARFQKSNPLSLRE